MVFFACISACLGEFMFQLACMRLFLYVRECLSSSSYTCMQVAILCGDSGACRPSQRRQHVQPSSVPAGLKVNPSVSCPGLQLDQGIQSHPKLDPTKAWTL